MTGAVQVKICGVCRPEDARVAAAAGASYIGVILTAGYGRSQTLAQAGVILDAAARVVGASGAGDTAQPGDASSPRRVGVFVDGAVDDVAHAARVLALDAVQLHGDESAELVRRVRDAVTCEVWKALRVRSAADVARGAPAYANDVDALLLDGWSAGAHGGAGVQFDWNAVAGADVTGGAVGADVTGGAAAGSASGSGRGRAGRPRLIVAGGLDPANVADAVALLRPSVVDVSSGVESAPCMKSPERIYAFIAAARGARITR